MRLYLVCRFEGYYNERIVALPRILQAVITEEAFPWPSDFNLENYCNSGHFGISHGRKVRLTFRIDRASGQHLLESPLAIDQVVNVQDEALVITASVVETELLHRWLRGWGDMVCEVEMIPLSDA